MAIIHSIYRYPVKGLSPEALPRIALAPGETVPGDRLYAIENGPSGFDPSAPAYLSKQHFLMLMKNERLAALRTAFDQASHVLRIQDGESEAARGDLRADQGRAGIENFFATSFADELHGSPKILHADGHGFSDVASKVVSIINLTSVAALEDIVDATVNPLASAAMSMSQAGRPRASSILSAKRWASAPTPASKSSSASSAAPPPMSIP